MENYNPLAIEEKWKNFFEREKPSKQKKIKIKSFTA